MNIISTVKFWTITVQPCICHILKLLDTQCLVVIIPATTATILPNQYKIDQNFLNFRARSLKFCMQVDLDHPLQKSENIKKH